MTRIDERKLLRALLRERLSAFVARSFEEIEPTRPFVSSAFIDLLCDRLETIEQGKATRQIVNLPPRHLKSIIASICLVAWVLGRSPGRRIVLVSYGSDLVERHMRLIRQIMKAKWYTELFFDTRISRSKETNTTFETTAGGRVIGTTIEGALTGHGGDLIIIDDPIKAGDTFYEKQLNLVNDWVSTTLLSRLDDKSKDQILVVMQRLHVNDLSGYLMERGGWEALVLPALAIERERIPYGHGKVFERESGAPLFPERETKEVLEQIKREQGSYAFSSQYQQQPVPLEGNALQVEWLKVYRDLPTPDACDQVVQAWDLGVKDANVNDYSACVTLRYMNKKFYVVHVWRGRLLYPDLKAKVIALAEAFGSHRVLIEDTATGPALIAELRTETSLPIIAAEHKGMSKAERILMQSIKIEAGQVLLPETAPWLEDFLNEYRAFPNGKHDDVLDALAYALNFQKGMVPPDALICAIESPFARAVREGYGLAYFESRQPRKPWL